MRDQIEQPFSALPDPKLQRIGRRTITRKVVAVKNRFSVTAKQNLPGFAQNILFFGGIMSVALGFGMIYRPLGLIVGGALSVWVAMLVSAERNEPGS